MPLRVAAVTMTFNEPDWLPIWARHYASELGATNCYVVDHGSTDGSTAGLGAVNVMRIPRSPQDDERRAAFMSEFCGSLLRWYDAVLHSDVDEIVVADPRRHAGLLSFCEADRSTVVTATGLDVVHLPATERALNLALPVTRQRRWLRFSSAMCKPVLVREPVRWTPGFHTVETDPAFGDLFLFHLRYSDLGRGLSRLAKTRVQPWSGDDAGAHQRVGDDAWRAMLYAIAGLPRVSVATLDPSEVPVATWLDRVRASTAGRGGERYRIDLHLFGNELWRLPNLFVDRF